MKCFDCKKQIDEAVGYEGLVLCYPCYELEKAAVASQ